MPQRHTRRTSVCLTAAAAVAAMALAAPLAVPATANAAAVVQQEATVKVGDPAPPLVNGEYVKGEPVKEFEKGKVYVMEFWATWCGPCIAAIPHVTELQEKYKDDGLIVIGQNVWENDEAAVKPFVENMGDKMGYRVAYDDGGKMAEQWMRAAGQNGIPASFIIDREGKIAWIGHPMSMDGPLEKVLAGNFDAKAEAEKAKKTEQLGMQISQAMQAGETDKAVKLLDQYAEMNPQMAGQIEVAKFNILLEAEKYDDAYAMAGPIIEKSEDPAMLNEMAWMIVMPDSPVKQQDLDVAMKAAEKSVKLSEKEDGDTRSAGIDTLARVHFLKGDVAKAAELQQQAIDLVETPELKRQLQETMREYQGEAM